MADFNISIAGEKFDFFKRFGSCTLDILASERIYISLKEVSNLRKAPTSFLIGGITELESNVYELAEGGSSSIHANEFRVGERVVGVNGVGKNVFFGIVVSIGTTLVINASYILEDINTASLINVPTDDYIDEKRAVELDTNQIKFMIMASSTGGVIDVNQTNFLKKKANLGGGGSGPSGTTYTNPNPTPTTIGGISAGTTFLNQTMQQMWDALLYPYQAPAFTSFSVSGASTLECGDTLPANQTANWGTSNSGNVNANSIDINNTTPAQSLVTGTANDGTEPLVQSAITKNSPTTNTWQIKGVNSQGSNFTRNYSKHWYWALYYGEDANAGPLVEADIEALRVKMLASGFARNYSFNGGATYKYLAYPTSMGTATTFTDTGSGFAVAMETPYVVSVTNAFGVTTDYRVHRTTNILNSAITIAVS